MKRSLAFVRSFTRRLAKPHIVPLAKEENGRPFYATLAYANAFGLGVIDVAEWKTAILVRQIPGARWHDAVGCYPLAAIDSAADLPGGVHRLREAGLVSIALVPDPLMAPSLKELEKAFAICRPFKTHYVIDNEGGGAQFSHMHRKWARKASRLCTITAVKLQDTLADWSRLYEQVVGRHEISDVQKFDLSYFAALARMPQVEAFAAIRDDRIVAMALWVCSGEVAYYHLAASAPEGYRAQAMYGIVAHCIDYYRDCRFIHLGGGAGTTGSDSGLISFKSGFANLEVTAYFCGSCLDDERYAALSSNRTTPTSFFPAYRKP